MEDWKEPSQIRRGERERETRKRNVEQTGVKSICISKWNRTNNKKKTLTHLFLENLKRIRFLLS